MMTKVIDTLHLCSALRRPCWAEVTLLKGLAVARLRRLKPANITDDPLGSLPMRAGGNR